MKKIYTLFILLLCLGVSLEGKGQNFRTLKHFPANASDGHGIWQLILASNGKLYGITSEGGSSNEGTLFCMDIDGSNYSILVHFAGNSKGNNPKGLIQGSDGKLYGNTHGGGVNAGGVIFRLNLDGSGYEIIHEHTFGNGYNSQQPIFQADDGKLYGVINNGMAIHNVINQVFPNPIPSSDVIFRLNPDGTSYEEIYHFNNTIADGLAVYCGFMQANNGKLYGLTEWGGINNQGVIFSLNLDGSGFQKLIDFDGINKGAKSANGSLMQASDGKIYGVTSQGGVTNDGVIFRLNVDGSGFQKLLDFGFSTSQTYGNQGVSFLEAPDGKLYGTNYNGGNDGNGKIYSINKDGTGFQSIFDFSTTNGIGVWRKLIYYNNRFYGITNRGGIFYLGYPNLNWNLGGTVFTFKVSPPSVTSISSTNSNNTYKIGDNIDITITFDENVVVTGTPQLTLETGTTDRNATYQSGSGANTLTFRYTVQTGDVSNDLDYVSTNALILNGGSIKSGGVNASLTLPAPASPNSLGANKVIRIDGVRPTVSNIIRQNPTAATTTLTSVVFRVSFSENVSGIGIGDFTLTKTLSANGNIANVSATSGTQVEVTVDNITGNGTLRLDVPTSATLTDDAGNALTAAFTTGQSYNINIDSTPPTVFSITRQNPTATNTNLSSVVFRVTFSEEVTGVDFSDFLLTTSGSASGTVASVAIISGEIADVTVNNIAGTGTLRLNVPNTATIQDLNGNALTTNFSTGEIYNIDRTAPTVVSIVRQNPMTATTNASLVVYTINFSENITGLALTNFSLTKTGTADGTIVNLSATAGNSINVTVNNISGAGTLRLDLSSVMGIVDASGNVLAGVFGMGEVYTIDRVAPTITSIARQSPTATTTNANSVVFRVLFSKNVNGVATNDFVLRLTGSAIGNIANVSAASGTTIDVTVNNLSGRGTIELGIVTPTITDDLGNNLVNSSFASQAYTIDRAAPTVAAITRFNPMSSATTATSVIFKVDFSGVRINAYNL